jgi:hypothetical protein
MNLRLISLYAGGLLTAVAAQSPVTVSPGTGGSGREIPADFVGLSFEMSNLLPDKNGRYLFSAENERLIRLFRVAGIKNLRVGGGTAEISTYAVPGPADIDRLFAFARAADVRVIYTLRLLNGDRDGAAAIAKYIADHHQSRLDSFSIGNEPDWHAYHTYPGHALDPEIVETTPGVPGSAYPSFLAKWRGFAAAVLRRVPEAKLAGPDTGSNHPVFGAKNTDSDGKSWTERFVADERASGRIATAFHHDYVGQSATDVGVPAAIDAMLSPEWVATNYPALHAHVLAPVLALGVPYRLTESNDHTGGVDGASNAFVSALWALDYLHWHAAHGAIGVNFHNKRWIHTCTIVQDPTGGFRLNPKAYGLKAFSLGSRGRVDPLTLANRDGVNLTAYAVRGMAGYLVTLINKEHGPGARAAAVSLVLLAPATRAEAIFLTAPNGDPAARTGITLGGAAIGDDGSWSGHWTPLTATEPGRLQIDVPAATAAILQIKTTSLP